MLPNEYSESTGHVTDEYGREKTTCFLMNTMGDRKQNRKINPRSPQFMAPVVDSRSRCFAATGPLQKPTLGKPPAPELTNGSQIRVMEQGLVTRKTTVPGAGVILCGGGRPQTYSNQRQWAVRRIKERIEYVGACLYCCACVHKRNTPITDASRRHRCLTCRARYR